MEVDEEEYLVHPSPVGGKPAQARPDLVWDGTLAELPIPRFFHVARTAFCWTSVSYYSPPVSLSFFTGGA